MSPAATTPQTKSAPPQGQQPVPWNPWLGALYVVFIFFATQIAAVIFLSIIFSIKGAIDGTKVTEAIFTDSIAGQFLYVLIAEVLAIVATIGFVRGYGAKLQAIGLVKPRWADLGYALIATPAYYLLYLVTVGAVSALVTGLNVDQEQDIGFNNVHGTLEMAMTFISLAVLPPLAEEIMVRGFLYSSLKKAMKLVPAAIVTSLIFAAAHLPEGGDAGPLYVAALDTFVLSLVLIYLREKTGSLWASIGLHAIKNSVAFLALFVFNAR